MRKTKVVKYLLVIKNKTIPKICLAVFCLIFISILRSIYYIYTENSDNLVAFHKIKPNVTFNLEEEEKWLTINAAPIKNKKILLAVGVLSKLSRIGRRQSIRITWFRQCAMNPNIVQCRFFTDEITETTENLENYKRESEQNKDILYKPKTKGGTGFTKFLIWMMKWFLENYQFQYFLRVDDDYFICMNRLLMELPQRPKNALYWGYVHCINNIVRVDEGWMVLSRDFIEEALSKYNTTLICHLFADQAVPFWINESKLNATWFLDNDRIIHSVTSLESEKYANKDLCGTYLSLHGTYQTEMLKYWISSESKAFPLRLNDDKMMRHSIPEIPKLTDVCKADMDFKTETFLPGMRFEPKLCKDNPTWEKTMNDIVGREDSAKPKQA